MMSPNWGGELTVVRGGVGGGVVSRGVVSGDRGVVSWGGGVVSRSGGVVGGGRGVVSGGGGVVLGCLSVVSLPGVGDIRHVAAVVVRVVADVLGPPVRQQHRVRTLK